MTQNLYVVGPNLRDQSKGSFHVHAEGCRDMQRMAKRDQEFQVELDNGAVEFDSLTGVVDYCYPPGDFECESGEYMSDFHFAPCVKLPVS
jgi:hypothetical protein